MWSLNKTTRTDLFSTLKTARLLLRPAEVSDYKAWKQVRGDNQTFLKPYEPSWPKDCLSEAFFDRRVERLAHDWRNDNTYGFLIFRKNTSDLIGGININNVTRGAAQYATLGYWLSEDSQGQGYMGEAAGAIIRFAFTGLRLNRLNAATLPHNEKSRTMLLRLGFVEEGYAKTYIQIDGKRQDHVLYGLNDIDFRPGLTHQTA